MRFYSRPRSFAPDARLVSRQRSRFVGFLTRNGVEHSLQALGKLGLHNCIVASVNSSGFVVGRQQEFIDLGDGQGENRVP